jgi:hypothetical protein
MEATEEAITHFFNSKMAEMNLLSATGLGDDLQGLGLKGDQPVISVHLNYEKNYAFVEVSVSCNRRRERTEEPWKLTVSRDNSSATPKKRATPWVSMASSSKTTR